MAWLPTLKDLGDSMRQTLTDPYNQGNGIYQYDPNQKPADLRIAKEHALARRIYKQGTENISSIKCPCCALPVEGGDLLPICSNLEELYQLGSGYSLYFAFYKHNIFLLTMIFFISGIYNIITNYQGQSCIKDLQQWENTETTDPYCAYDHISEYSIANKRDNTENLEIQLYLDFVAICLMVPILQFSRYSLRRVSINVDQATYTPSDYTVQLDGIPTNLQDQMSKDEIIIKWLENEASPGYNVKVLQLNRAYNISQYIELAKQRDEVLSELLEKKKMKDNELLKQRRKFLTDQMKKIRKEGFTLVSTAFATFETAQQAFIIRHLNEKGSCFHHINKFRKERIIEITRAPEPTDINWQNLGQSFFKKYFKRVLNLLVLLLISGIICAAITYMTYIQFTLSIGNSYEVFLINLAISIGIAILDPITCFIIQELIKSDRHSTKTNYISSTSAAITIAKFINNGITVILARVLLAGQYKTKNGVGGLTALDFYGPAGTNPNMFVNLITNAFLNPLGTLIDPVYILKKLKRKWALFGGNKNSLTQKEANEIFEGPEYDLEIRYGFLISTTLLQVLYTVALPLSTPYVTLAAILNYWADKYYFLRVISLPPALSSRTQVFMSKLFDLTIIFYAIGDLIYYYTLQDSDSNIVYFQISNGYLIWVALLLGIIVYIFPIHSLTRCICHVDETPTESLKYQEAKKQFYSEYQLENPYTRKQAILELLSTNILNQVVNDRRLTFLKAVIQKNVGHERKNTILENRKTVNQEAATIPKASQINFPNQNSLLDESILNDQDVQEEDVIEDSDGLDEYALTLLQDPVKASRQIFLAEKATNSRMSIFNSKDLISPASKNQLNRGFPSKLVYSLSTIEMVDISNEDSIVESRRDSIWGNEENV